MRTGTAFAIGCGGVVAACGLDAVGSAILVEPGSGGLDGGGDARVAAADASTASDAASDDAPSPAFVGIESTDSGGFVDFTADGSLDWGHWGLFTYPTFNRKIGGALVSDCTMGGTGTNGYQNTNSPTFIGWTNGTPTTVPLGPSSGYHYYRDADDASVTFTIVAASPAERIADVYGGGYQSRMRIRADLTDGSANAFREDESLGIYSKRWRIRYRTNPGKTADLRVRLEMVTRATTEASIRLAGVAVR
jgi:hypothetical protein